MHKAILVGVLAILLLPTAFALALGLPDVGELMFEPNKEYSLQYTVHNNAPEALPIRPVLSVPTALSDYVLLDKDVTTIPAQSTEKITMTIKLPDKLEPGLYTISFTVTENAAVEGSFVAHVGASHTVKILNPYPTGKPLLEFKGPKSMQPGNNNIEIGVRNIGRTDLDEIRINAIITDGKSTQQEYSERVTIPALGNKELTIPFTTKLDPGMYKLTVNATKADAITIPMQLGEPKITIDKIDKHSSENILINLKVTNKWNLALTNATLALIVRDSQNKQLFEASGLQTLSQGENDVKLRIMKPKYLQNGKYAADLQVLSPPHFIGASGEFEVELTEIGRLLQEEHPEAPPAWEYEEVALDMPRVQKAGKNKTLIALVLIIAIAIFLLSMAMLFRKKQGQNETPQIQPKA